MTEMSSVEGQPDIAEIATSADEEVRAVELAIISIVRELRDHDLRSQAGGHGRLSFDRRNPMFDGLLRNAFNHVQQIDELTAAAEQSQSTPGDVQ